MSQYDGYFEVLSALFKQRFEDEDAEQSFYKRRLESSAAACDTFTQHTVVGHAVKILRPRVVGQSGQMYFIAGQ